MISVLYVDDEPDFLELVRIFLERTGEFQVATSRSAREALADPAIRSYDAVISDYQMPGMNGIAFLKAVREGFGDVPFILFTGRGREEVVIEAINNGADFYVQKGGNPKAQFAELAHMVRQAVAGRRAKATLAEQEQRYLDLQNANDLIQSVTPDGHFRFVNTRWLDTLGYTAEEIPNLTIFDIIHEDSTDYCTETFQRVMAGESVGIIDAIFKTRDGRKVYVQGIADCKIVDGAARYTRGLFKDVTERLEAEKALRESEHKFVTLFKSSPIMLTLASAIDGTLIDVSDAFLRSTGYGREEVIGRRTEEIGLFADHAGYIGFVTTLQAGRPVEGMKMLCRSKNGAVSTCRFFSKMALINGRPHILSAIEDVTEQKQAEEAVRESEERYRLILENASEGILVNELTPRGPGRFIDVNDAACRILEMTREELREMRLIDLDTPETKRRAPALVQELMEKKQAVFQIDFRTKNGREKVIEISVSLFGLKGKPTMLSVIRDITEQKAAASALNALVTGMVGTTGREALDRMAESISAWLGADCVMIGEITPDGERVQLLSMLLDGKNVPDYSYILKGTPCEDTASVGFCVYPENAARLFPGSLDLRDLKIQGYAGTPLRDSTGRVVGILCILSRTPLTLPPSAPEILEIVAAKAAAEIGRMTAEKALSESEEKFRTLVEHSLDGILILDPEGTILFANHAAGRLVGVEDLAGLFGKRNVIEFIAPESQEDLARDFENVAGGTDGYIARYRITTMNQEVRWIESLGKTIVFNGAPSILVSLRDVTERQRMEDALHQANTKLNLLSGITRHDISNQLQILNGYLGLLQENDTDPSFAERLSRVATASGRISSMIQFTGEYQEVGVNRPAWHDLRALVEDAGRSAGSPQVAFFNEIPGEVEVFADPLISKVFFNLIDNALRHGGKVTTVRFASEVRDGDCVVVCEDDGDGVPPGEKEKIFGRGVGKHTGFGLSLSREILDITGITIREVGEAGRGAWFEITIPKGQYRVGPE
ncbi:PAS domain S-box protein [Methanoculleus sp.]|uniref:PAS domain S-box protein n=1 Tax=Methanoculleus sp. TaxID=90427 RepID=UPI002FC70FF2